MLDKLLKHNSLGSKEEILFILFNAISSKNEQSITDLKSFCISHKYNISKSFDGIISLLNYIGFVGSLEGKIKLNAKIFDLKESDINLSSVENNEFLTKGNKINKIDILFKKIEKNND